MPAPRCVKLEEAAAYAGMPVRAFRAARIGLVQLGVHTRYDLRAIDAYLDRASGLTADSLAPPEDDAEAAFVRSAPDLEDASRRP